MHKIQHRKVSETTGKKKDSTVLVSIIGGIATIIVALITVVTPLVLKSKDTKANSTIPTISVGSSQTGITQTSATPNDLLSVASNYLNDVQVVYIDTIEKFSEANWTKWSDQQSVSLENGALKLTGLDNDDVGFDRNNLPIIGGQGVLLHFKYIGNLDDRVHFSFGLTEMNKQWPANRNFQIFDNNPPFAGTINLHDGENNDSTHDLAGFTLKTDTWYGLLLTIDPEARLLAIIWDPSNPSLQIKYQDPVGNSDWLNLSWFFEVGLPKGMTGSLLIKDFTQFSYSSFK